MRLFLLVCLLALLTVLLIVMKQSNALPPKSNSRPPKDAISKLHSSTDQAPPKSVPVFPENRDILKQVQDRAKSLTRVTDQPYMMHLWMAIRCSNPWPSELPENNPHMAHAIHVYVSPQEAETLRTGKGTYAVGTLVLKEKLLLQYRPEGTLADPEKAEEKSAPSPQFFTAMLKREAGYHSECGDWEFLVISGDAFQVQARGKIDSCIGCHQEAQATDFVTRTYTPAMKQGPAALPSLP